MLMDLTFLIHRRFVGFGLCYRSAYRKDFFKKMKATHRFPMKVEYDGFLKELHTNFTDQSVVKFCRNAKRNRLRVQV